MINESYEKERDAAITTAIKSQDIGIFENFIKRHTDLYSYYFLEIWNQSNANTKWGTVMKMACNCENVSQEIKEQAKKWLTLRGYDSEL